MSTSKTLITHARTRHAHFLGYAISVYLANDKLTRVTGTPIKTRSINGGIRLGLPYGLVDELAKRYRQNGKPVHESALLHYSDAHIIDVYQRRFRGLAEYYKYAVDRRQLGKLKYMMETALAKTLAGKFKTSVANIYRKYKGTRTVDGYAYKTLQVEVPTSRGTRCIYWGAVPLKVVHPGSEPITDTQYREKLREGVSDLIRRLHANECEVCGSDVNCQVHHVRKLADLKRRWRGRKEKPGWVKRMIALQRKTLIVCRRCHVDIHAGRPLPQHTQLGSGEPDDAKVSRPVRRGTVGKVPMR